VYANLKEENLVWKMWLTTLYPLLLPLIIFFSLVLLSAEQWIEARLVE